MPRSKSVPAPQKDKGAKVPPHPLFPTLDASAIASLWLYRMVRNHRAGKHIPEKLARFAPHELTSEAHIEAYGAGIFRVLPLGPSGHMLGDPFVVRVRDSLGRVPDLVSDFEEVGGGGDARGAAAFGEEAQRLYQGLFDRMERNFDRIRSEDRAMGEANFAAFGSLLDRSIAGMSAVAAASAGVAREPAPAQFAAPGMEKWVVAIEAERKRADNALRRTHELELEAERVKARGKARGGDDGGGLEEFASLLKIGAPLLKEFFQPQPPTHTTTGNASRDAATPDAVSVVDGHEVPSVAYLTAIEGVNGTRAAVQLNAEALRLFRELHSAGRLSPDYIAAIGLDYLEPGRP